MRMAKGQVLAVFLSVAVGVLLPSACTGYLRIYPRYIADADENGKTNLWCYYTWHTDGSLTWTLTTDTNTTLHLGTCYEGFGSCISQYNDTQLERHGGYTYLTFFNIQRDMGGRLSCSATDSNNKTESDDVLLNVYSKPVLENCSLDIVFENWSAVWECDVPRVFSSRGLYSFQVHEAFQCRCADEASFCLRMQEVNTEPLLKPRCAYHGQISYRPCLTSYINDTEDKQYYRGHMVYSWRLQSGPANNWTIKIYVCAGADDDTCASFKQSLYMFVRYHPKRPEHNCTDVTYIPETGADISCMCKASFLGWPYGRLLWKRGNTTLVTGKYAVPGLLLPAGSLTTDQEGDEVTCQVDWILAKNAWPPLMVAYGPDNVELRDYLHYDVNDTWLLTVECHVTRLNPVNPEMVQWEGLCSGQTGFTCIVNAQETEVDGKIVKCRVTNPANGGRSAEAAKTVKTVKTDLASHTTSSPRPSSTTPPAENPGSDGLKWAAVGGGVVLAMEVVIGLLVTLGVCLYRRGLPCLGPIYDSTKPQEGQRATTSDAETHFYEVIAPSVGRGGGDVPLETNPDHTYVNTYFQDQEGHI